ncbi:hypothetical protein NBM05_08530 [Rothia sp. AR01]|uniref:Uncharacterized protein n=1 Tax=Rothia santali TaxID=2949643 RepID=A0A9X2HFZ4_9MICC|nr:hypothetical protein [Rothia santali]MCP3426047.1 hypothetical protein [Rothia santali]
MNFWQRSGEAWALEAYILTEAGDVLQVLRWVEENRRDRVVEVFVEIENEPIGDFMEERRASLVRVYGENPNGSVSSTFVMARRDPPTRGIT